MLWMRDVKIYYSNSEQNNIEIVVDQAEQLSTTDTDEGKYFICCTITSGWFKKGSTPKVKSFPGRFKTSYSGFVIPESGSFLPRNLKSSTMRERLTIFAHFSPCTPRQGEKVCFGNG